MAFLTMALSRQRVATHGNGSRLFEPLSRRSHLRPVAIGCDCSAPKTLHPAPRRSSRERVGQFATTGFERENARACECALLPAVLTPRTIRRISAQGYFTRWAAAAAAVS
jgi:hypothetical protein